MSSGRTWRDAQRQATAALRAHREEMNSRDGVDARAKQYLLVARGMIGEAVRLDARPLPGWSRRDRGRG